MLPSTLEKQRTLSILLKHNELWKFSSAQLALILFELQNRELSAKRGVSSLIIVSEQRNQNVGGVEEAEQRAKGSKSTIFRL